MSVIEKLADLFKYGPVGQVVMEYNFDDEMIHIGVGGSDDSLPRFQTWDPNEEDLEDVLTRVLEGL